MTTHPTEAGLSFQRTALANGLQVVTSEMPHTHSVTVSIFIGVGSRYEPEDRAGVSHFIEHILFKGTERRPTPIEISGAIEGNGGVLNAGTEQELTVYWCKVAEPHFRESLDLLVDMLRRSLFEPESIEKERMVVIEELNMVSDNPASKVDVLMDEMLWPDHPLGRDIGGTKASINGMTREVILDYMSDHYVPGNIVVSVAGNVPHDEVVELVEELCGDWPAAATTGWDAFFRGPDRSQVRLEYRGTDQAHLSIGLPGVSLEDPDRYPMDLMNVILGEGMSSRLFVEVRENRGLAYDIGSGVTHFLDCGALIVTAGVDPKRVYGAVETILDELGRMRKGVDDEELERAKRLVAGRLMLRMEDTRAVAGWMGNQQSLQGRVLELGEVVERVKGVTPADVRRVAGDLLVGDRLNIAVVGPVRGQRRLERLLRL